MMPVNPQQISIKPSVRSNSGLGYFKNSGRRKNFIAENKKVLKLGRGRETAPLKDLWKSKKFRNVESRVMKHELLRGKKLSTPHSVISPPLNLINVSKSNSKDFIEMNAKRAFSRPSTAPPLQYKKQQEGAPTQHVPGEIPAYLLRFREESREAQKKEQKRCIPEGHALLSERERTQVLHKLIFKQQQLLSQLNSMPLRNDTVRVRSAKEALCGKIENVDNNICKLSKSIVLLKMD